MRVAPRAARTDSSRSRRTILASSRLAIEAQTMSSTNPAVPSSTHNVVVKFCVSSVFSGTPTALNPVAG